VGFRVYADRQWYVGENEGHVAVYQGIPAQLWGIRFSHVAVDFPELPAATVEQLPLYSDLTEGITSDTREGALAIVQQMKVDTGNVSGGTGGPTPSTSPTPSPKSSGGG
ncbi:MAG TPA: hypothetical protein VH989_07640, partial [Actinomycetota bacterium]